jgi:hypothetical protein
VLQTFTDHTIGAKEVWRGYPLSIGRIGNHYALVLRLHEILKVLLFNGDISRKTCSLCVKTGGIYCLDVYIIAVDMVIELTFLAIVILDIIKEICIEV